MKILTGPKILLSVTILIPAIWAKPIGQVVPITFLEKVVELKTQFNSLHEQGKTIKANKTWDAADALIKRQFKDGVWYALPEKCFAKKGHIYSVHVECFDTIAVGDNTDGIQFTFEIINGKNHDKLLEMIQDTGDDFLELSFRVGKSSSIGMGQKYTAYAHTGLLGITVYVTDIKIHARRKDPNVTEEPTPVAEVDQTFKEKLEVWVDHIYPMLSTLELQPERLPKPKSCFVPNERVSKGALADMQRIVQEKSLSLDLTDLMKLGSHELCDSANHGKANEACLDACVDRVFDYWK